LPALCAVAATLPVATAASTTIAATIAAWLAGLFEHWLLRWRWSCHGTLRLAAAIIPASTTAPTPAPVAASATPVIIALATPIGAANSLWWRRSRLGSTAGSLAAATAALFGPAYRLINAAG
jgi:hypothetical protein